MATDMNALELSTTLERLGLEPAEAAQLLSVAPRTMRRWLLEGEEIPGPAIVALRAWRAMHERNLTWKPDAQSLFDDDQDQIARYRKHIVDLDAALKRVEQRGGPASFWAVDLSKNAAIFGPYEVHFYQLKSEAGFSLSSYRRRDAPPNLSHDMPLLEDAVYCIAKTVAMTRVAVPALRKVAEYTRKYSHMFVVDGPKLLTPTQKEKRQLEIEILADRIDELADGVAVGKGSYAQFEDILTKLHTAGFFPMMGDISAVAKAMT